MEADIDATGLTPPPVQAPAENVAAVLISESLESEQQPFRSNSLQPQNQKLENVAMLRTQKTSSKSSKFSTNLKQLDTISEKNELF